MKADVLKFVACYFLGTLEVWGFSRTPGQNLCIGDPSWIFLITWISQIGDIVRTKTIVDEKLRSVSFHNDLWLAVIFRTDVVRPL